LKILWEELARRNHTLLYAIRFLTSLNEGFGMVKSQTLLMDPLPSMNKIFSMVLQYERQHTTSPTIDDSALINAVDSKKFKGKKISGKPPFQGSNSKGNTRVCTFCGSNNHTVETCWKKHGVPPHLQKNYNSGYANHVVPEGDNHVAESSTSVDNKGSAPDITHEQYERLMTLLRGSSLNQSSGTVHASNHVTSMHVGHSPSDTQGTSFINSLTNYNFTQSS